MFSVLYKDKQSYRKTVEKREKNKGNNYQQKKEVC